MKTYQDDPQLKPPHTQNHQKTIRPMQKHCLLISQQITMQQANQIAHFTQLAPKGAGLQ